MRHCLRNAPRSIQKDANILVVLTESARQKRNTPKKLAYYLPERRYKDFFGENGVEFDFNGVEGYFSPFLGEKGLSKKLSSLKGLLTRRIPESPKI